MENLNSESRIDYKKVQVDEIKNNNKCECFHTETSHYLIYDPFTGTPTSQNTIVGRCWGTRERDLCYCGGDENKCDFYTEKRGQQEAEDDLHKKKSNSFILQRLVESVNLLNFMIEVSGLEIQTVVVN